MLTLPTAVTLLGIIAGAPDVEFMASSANNINGIPMNSPQCLAINPRTEEFLVADNLNDRIIIFDTLGNAVFAFSLGDDRHSPFGVAVDSHDEIIVGAIDHGILWRFDYNGGYIDETILPDGVLPGRLLMIDNDNILIVDRAGDGIAEMDRAGQVVRRWTSGANRCKPSSAFFLANGKLAMVSSEGDVVTGFAADGTREFAMGIHGRLPEDFSHPTAAVVDSIGWIWVIDSFRHHIKRFDSQRKFVDIFGRRGLGPGEFYFPTDMKLTPSGKLGILDKGAGRLQIFRITYGKN